MRNAMMLLLGCAVLWACEDTRPPVQERAEPVAAAVTAAVKEAPPPAAAAEATEKNQAQKAVDENPLTPCCRALSRVGFVQRSPEYTAAAKICGEGMTQKLTLAQIVDDLKKTLKAFSLPEECSEK